MDINELQNAAIEAATAHIKNQRSDNRMARLRLYCLTIFACVLVLGASVIACFAIHSQQQTIIEQQYALNMQYAGLLDYVSGAEITEYYADSEEGGTAVAGDSNMVIGGDYGG